MKQKPFHVVVVGNYLRDNQTSMQKFAGMISGELAERDIGVEFVAPIALFSKLARRPGGLAKWLGYLDKFLLFPRTLRRRCQARARCSQNRTLVHICDHSNSMYVGQLCGMPHIVTCHDMIAIRLASGALAGPAVGWPGRLFQRWILSSVQQAHWIACDSETTRRDLLKTASRSHERTTTIHCQLNYPFSPVAPEAAWDLLRGAIRRDGGPIILHVGNNAWYKNRDGVLRIFAAVRQSTQQQPPRLAIMGSEFTRAQRQFIVEHGLTDCVHWLPGVTNDELQAAYSIADVFLFPSLYEGFGWPPLEAQACGCPVVAGTGGSLAEVLENSALTADARDESRLTGFAVDLLRDPALHASVRTKGLRNVARFRPPRMIDDYIALYRRVLDDKRARS